MSKDVSYLLTESVKKAVYAALALAELYCDCKFPVGDISFNLRGRSAGQVRFPVSRNAKVLPEMRFNMELLTENVDEFINEVVPHECAHLVVYHLYLKRKLKVRSKPKPHGVEWQSVMQKIYGLTPRVTHSFDVKKTQSKRFSYACGCYDKTHHLSLIRHNKVQREVSNYLCRACGQVLKLAVTSSE